MGLPAFLSSVHSDCQRVFKVEVLGVLRNVTVEFAVEAHVRVQRGPRKTKPQIRLIEIH